MIGLFLLLAEMQLLSAFVTIALSLASVLEALLVLLVHFGVVVGIRVLLVAVEISVELLFFHLVQMGFLRIRVSCGVFCRYQVAADVP